MGDKAIAKAERGVRLFSLFDGLSGDLLFWVAIDTLFLTYVKHLSPAEIVSLTAVAAAAGMLFQFPGLWLIGKIGASSSVTVGTVILLFSALSLTFGPTYGFMAAGRALREVAFIFINMKAVSLKNNLELLHREEEYVKIRSGGSTIYAAVTMVIAFVSGSMFNLSPYFPMGCCLFFCLFDIVLSLFLGGGRPGTAGKDRTASPAPKTKLSFSGVILLALISYCLYLPLVNSGQEDGKLFMQGMLSEEYAPEKVTLWMTSMLAFSRIVRLAGNLVFPFIHRKMKDGVGVLLGVLLCLSTAFMITGYFLPFSLPLRFAVATLGYVFILFIRDPLKNYLQSLLARLCDARSFTVYINLLGFGRRLIRFLLTLFFSYLLLSRPLIDEMGILLVLTAGETLVSVLLFAAIRREERRECRATV